MHLIETKKQIAQFERERALVGTYIDHVYSQDRLDWILGARQGFDSHVGNAFHLLIPHKSNGYSVNNTWKDAFGVELARAVINDLEIKHGELPCIVFRSSGENYFFLKLGNRDKDTTLSLLGQIGDLAVECKKDGPIDPDEFRKWVNMQTANFLRRERVLSALGRSLPALNALLGAVVDLKELV